MKKYRVAFARAVFGVDGLSQALISDVIGIVVNYCYYIADDNPKKWIAEVLGSNTAATVAFTTTGTVADTTAASTTDSSNAAAIVTPTSTTTMAAVAVTDTVNDN